MCLFSVVDGMAMDHVRCVCSPAGCPRNLSAERGANTGFLKFLNLRKKFFRDGDSGAVAGGRSGVGGGVRVLPAPAGFLLWSSKKL